MLQIVLLLCRLSAERDMAGRGPSMKKWICVGAVALIVLGLGAWGYFEAAKRAWIRINEYDIRTEGSRVR